MKPRKMHKDKELKGKTFTLKGYYRGIHGEIRRKDEKIHLTKKQRRKVNKEVRERINLKGFMSE